MNTQTLAWWRMAMRVLMAARAWHLEMCHGRNRYDVAWNATPVERELFAAVSDMWADMYMQDRPWNSGVRRKDIGRCPVRDERLQHDA